MEERVADAVRDPAVHLPFDDHRVARLIRKVYEADPLRCPKCDGPVRVIALIDDPHVPRTTGLRLPPRLRTRHGPDLLVAATRLIQSRASAQIHPHWRATISKACRKTGLFY